MSYMYMYICIYYMDYIWIIYIWINIYISSHTFKVAKSLSSKLIN